ncbi:sn-glycerol-3-phosphate ABC transporter ATP-binding protein UgpC [Pseudaeromonas sp. ZJS20]|uniref:ABC transporter ATP-binding protein n=1 Tax=Pseudaeromonas aegiceratis TaxID=3153928 RepID=UPI00390CBBC1
MKTLQLIELGKAYHQHTVIPRLNLGINQGEFVVFVGPSGCGKSTLLRMIAGLESVTQGEIRLSGQNLNRVHPAQREIAMVFQSYALYPHMNVARNITFPLKMAGVAKAEQARRLAEVAQILHLTPLLDRLPGALSGGQRQRVAIGRAIVRNPALFLFDEPLSNLDAKLRNEMRLSLKQLHQQLQATILYVTHDQVEAMTLADRIVVLNQGLIEQEGSPQTLYDAPANRFVAGFIGTPGMNFLDGQWQDGQFQLAGGIRLSGLPAGTATLGLRPNQIRVDTRHSEVAMVIELVEPLGHSWLYYGRLAGQAIAVESTQPFAQGASLPLALGRSVCHCFDAAGQRLATREASLAD